MDSLLNNPSPAARGPFARRAAAKKAVDAEPRSPEGKIGPNAILQVLTCLETTPGLGKDEAIRIAHLAGLGHYLSRPPCTMVCENDVVALHQAVRRHLPEQVATAVLRQSGKQTARYILAHRIPKLAQWTLRALPAAPANGLLVRAIAKHAWTFAGSGTFTYQLGHPALIALANCPACERVYGADEQCTYYIATLEELFRTMVHRRARLSQEASAENDGDTSGRGRKFILSWR